MALPFGIILSGEGHPILNGKLPAVGLATVMAIFAVIPCFPLLSLIQRRWQDAGALLLTMLGSSVVGLFVFLLIRSGTLASYDIRFGVHAVLLNAGLVSLWFAVVCIPWGIPFWWPQEPDIAGTKLP
jgi:ABC-type tungstate transport system substrate-binding protein